MIERFRYTDCRMEITAAGSYTKGHEDDFVFDSVGDGGGLEYRFRVWLPRPFHKVGIVEFTLDTVDPARKYSSRSIGRQSIFGATRTIVWPSLPMTCLTESVRQGRAFSGLSPCSTPTRWRRSRAAERSFSKT